MQVDEDAFTLNHLGIVAWVENSRQKRFPLSRIQIDGNHAKISVELGESFSGPMSGKYGCFCICWKFINGHELPRTAICQVVASPNVDDDGIHIPDATPIYRVMSQSSDDILFRTSRVGSKIPGQHRHLRMPVRPHNHGSTLLASARLQINLLSTNLPEATINKFRAIIETGHLKILGDHNEQILVEEPPYVIFEFKFHLKSRDPFRPYQYKKRTREITSAVDENQPAYSSQRPGNSDPESDDAVMIVSGPIKKPRTSLQCKTRSSKHASRGSGASFHLQTPKRTLPTTSTGPSQSKVKFSSTVTILRDLNRKEQDLEAELTKAIQQKKARIKMMQNLLHHS